MSVPACLRALRRCVWFPVAPATSAHAARAWADGASVFRTPSEEAPCATLAPSAALVPPSVTACGIAGPHYNGGGFQRGFAASLTASPAGCRKEAQRERPRHVHR